MVHLIFYGCIIFYLVGCFLASFIAPITNRIIKDKNNQFFTQQKDFLSIFFLSWISVCVLSLVGLITYMDNYIKTNDKIKYWLEGD